MYKMLALLLSSQPLDEAVVPLVPIIPLALLAVHDDAIIIGEEKRFEDTRCTFIKESVDSKIFAKMIRRYRV